VRELGTVWSSLGALACCHEQHVLEQQVWHGGQGREGRGGER
jgi:hypothetical protein